MTTPPIEQKGQTRKPVEKSFNLAQLDELLLFNNEEEASISTLISIATILTRRHEWKLKDPQRRLIYQGSLGYNSKQKEYRVFLLDHALIITEPWPMGGRERLRMVDHPIPATLLQVSLNQTRWKIFGLIPLPMGQIRYQLRILSLGKRFNSSKAFTLRSPSAPVANTWIEVINTQRDANQQSPESNVLKLGQDMLTENGGIKVNCAVVYNDGQTILYGTNDGVYFQPQNSQSRRIIDLTNIRQIEVLEEHLLLIVLAERSVFTFPLDTLETGDPMNRMKRVATHTSSFQVGTCLGRTMVCTVKASSLSSTVKVLEAIDLPSQRDQTLSPDDKLKVFKECYLATVVHAVQFLKTKLCVAANNGFEIVDIETLETQSLLDPEDPKLKFARAVEPRPLSMYRIGGEFLLCYREFAFYVNTSGKKSEKDVVIYWEGTPTACALHYPYLVAFSPNFVEIRHVDDGSLVQVIHESSVQCLHSKGSPAEDLAYHLSRRRENSILVSSANKVMFLTPTPSWID